MRRWHEDRALMERRVKFVYEYFDIDSEPLYKVTEGFYRWRENLQQPGRWRKRKPLDCGNTRCGICHFDKWGRKKRGATKRAAIRFEIEAEGGGV